MKAKSKIFTLNVRDLVRGVIVAAGTAASTAVVSVLNQGRAPSLVELQTAGIAGLCAGGVYLLKNLFTNSAGDMLKSEK